MSTTRTRTAAVLAALVMVLAAAACGSGSEEDGSAEGGGATTSDWRTIPITDVTGATFTLAELEGRPVFVENFATWCPTCRSQLGRTQEAAAAMGEQAAFVVLSVETDLSAQAVDDYARDNGFTAMRFAVMSPELLAAVADTFGTSAVNPPSTPHVVIAADGSVGELQTGSISAAEIEEALGAG